VGIFIRKSVFRFFALIILCFGVSSPAHGAPNGCKYYSTGRMTCSYSSNGTTYYNSINPSTGYESFGSRTQSGSSSYGWNNYSTPKSYGYNSYNSGGLGSGSSWTNSYSWNSNSGSKTNSYSWNSNSGSNSDWYGNSSNSCYIICP